MVEVVERLSRYKPRSITRTRNGEPRLTQAYTILKPATGLKGYAVRGIAQKVTTVHCRFESYSSRPIIKKVQRLERKLVGFKRIRNGAGPKGS